MLDFDDTHETFMFVFNKKEKERKKREKKRREERLMKGYKPFRFSRGDNIDYFLTRVPSLVDQCCLSSSE